MISRLVLAIVYGVFAALGCLLLGLVLASLGIPVVTTIGHFLEQWSWVIGLLVGLLYFFSNSTWGTTLFRRNPPA